MEAPAKTINIRLKAVGKIRQVPEIENSLTYNVPPDAFKMGRQVFFKDEHSEWTVLDRGMLAPGNTFNGPLLVEERQHNLIVLPGQTLTVDAYMNLIIENPGEDQS
jgi:N-methylhydantoinase A